MVAGKLEVLKKPDSPLPPPPALLIFLRIVKTNLVELALEFAVFKADKKSLRGPGVGAGKGGGSGAHQGHMKALGSEMHRHL